MYLKRRLWNGGHFVQREMSEPMIIQSVPIPFRQSQTRVARVFL